MFSRNIPPSVSLVIFVIGWLGVMPMSGQILHGKEPLPSFEVASVRQWQSSPAPSAAPGAASRPAKVSPLSTGAQITDRVHFIGQVALLIASAYNVPVGSEGRMIVGGPDWLQSEGSRYDVQAKISDADFAAMQSRSPVQQREQVSLMEQSLLADRFALKVHFETREMPIYALVVAKEQARSVPAKDGETSRLSTVQKGDASEMTGVSITLDELTNSPLMVVDGRRVVNRTGLKERYDFTLNWTPAAAADASTNGSDSPPAIFTAMREQLGLRLVSLKEQVEVIVIDHVERPTAN